ncbi:methyltransferase [Daldinia loculata]|uniref:methyltransferase n=1 Tax=Daldinia loculata TaxID=103429 RepID=UPI0020C43445|nr:methyltransferase [Daldinia loculata]KAI1645660.1 methyltransferase [Daldinia loculata]
MNIGWILDSGYLPHAVIRTEPTLAAAALERKMAFIEALRAGPMAVETGTANAQHYEVGTGVLAAMLDPRMKYSGCLFPEGRETLAQAEAAMLASYVEKAALQDGMMAMLPKSKITAFSNSQSQKKYIDDRAQEKGFTNLTVITGDIVDYEFEANSFDRIISVELFEHMKNYELLMAKVARALKPDGKLFVHIFSHKTSPYNFENDWISTNFFTGGTMPSADLLLYFQKDLKIERQWWVNGMHYSKTCEHWLANMIAKKMQIWPHLEEAYGKENAGMWYNRWQIFHMACSELFAYQGGDTWGVSLYLFEKPKP